MSREAPRAVRSSPGLLVVALALAACDGGTSPPDAATDSGSPEADAAARCADDTECDDGRFCNGAERCAPADRDADALGCVAASAPACEGEARCDEDEDECVEGCADRDEDGDGHAPLECGGADCDDEDPTRYPGAIEICDIADHDEDCDPTTFGVRDLDGDGHPDAACCSVDDEGNSFCGGDCNDSRSDIYPGLVESCDGFDNDCDGVIDEGVLRTYVIDADGDGYASAAAGAATMQACFRPTGYAEAATDCDDARGPVHPGAPEVCDSTGLDEDCDGEANPAELCECLGTGSRNCALPGSCGAGTERCVLGSWGVCSIAPIFEVCNGLDDDCDAQVDEDTSLVRCFDDPDDDGYAAAGAAEAMRCPTTGRASRGFCPFGATNRSPFAAELDCTENEPEIYPGAAELCDLVNQDCDAATDEGLPLVTRYVDLDGDTRRGSAISACEGLPGTAPTSEDCDETEVTIFVGAPELCDRVDNNCGYVLDPGGVDPAEDADSDGFSSPTAGCTGGYDKTDCNDAVSSINTAVTEVCNGVDDDCDGGLDAADASMTACAGARSVQECSTGQCVITACMHGYASCDGLTTNGCETSLTTSAAHCGGCGISCGAAGECALGLCDRVVAIDGGSGHMCALRAGGQVACWGAGWTGQLGDDLGVGSLVPVRVLDINDASEIALGSNMGCARTDGAVQCWGQNQGQLGDGTTQPRNRPVSVVGLTDAVELAAGWAHACAVHEDGTLSCWGVNSDGRLGLGTTSDVTTPTRVTGLSGVADVEGGGTFTCVRHADGTARCWGNNGYGELGTGDLTFLTAPGAAVSGLGDATSLSLGYDFACAERGGEVSCWGRNIQRQIGDGALPFSSTPVAMSPGLMSNAVTVTEGSGSAHTCLARADGRVACWGANDSGQLGIGTVGGDEAEPQAVVGIGDARVVGSGFSSSCAFTATGRLLCWGANADGQLGNGSSGAPTGPSVVRDLSRVSEVVGGQWHSCARRTTGEVLCWGGNFGGALGDGTTNDRAVPAAVTGIDDAAALSSQGLTSCAIRAGGTVSCWGYNANGQVGDGTANDRAIPVAVLGLTGAVAVVVGGDHTCALLSDRTVRCWGAGGGGALGDGTSGSSLVPVTPAITAVAELALGGAHTCARRTTGEIWCWGLNGSGQLGSVPGSQFASPVNSGTLTDAVQIAAGLYHTCARRGNGEVWCWGANDTGQIGRGTVSSSLPPAPVPGITDAIDLCAGTQFTCALRPGAGGVVCWGSNASGQIGNASGVTATSPVNVTGLSNVVDIECGGTHVMARRNDGTLYGWGENRDGGLGGEDPGTPHPTPWPVVNVP